MNKPRSLFLSILCFFGILASAQPLPRTLLWRISGKDGHQPSYLYGTMHLTDERLFNLGDSLYEAIRRSDGLAIELDPNSLVTLALEEVQKQISDEKNIREMLSEKEFKTYGPMLAKKLGKPQSKITSRDIFVEKNKWVRQSFRSGKMRTFLDVYLFDIARRQRKWTGGVEDMVDQRGILNDVVDKSDILNVVADGNTEQHVTVQRMIDIYLRQDLDEIDTVFGDAGDKERILTKRNYKMAGRMDSLSGVRSMVFAVGAAHLPGKEGLINLLRARGFQVEPVFSSRKIKSADYPLPEISESWETVTDEAGSYRVEMPGKPSDLVYYGILNAKTFIDIFNSTGYVTMSVHSSFNANKTDSLLDAMAARIFDKDKKNYTPLLLDGARGRVYSETGTDGYKKGYLIGKNGIIYMAMASAGQPTGKSKGDIDRFLRSFHVQDPKPKTGESMKLTRFTDSSLSFTVVVPVQPKPFPQKNPQWISHVFVGSDQQEGVYYFFGVNSVLPGHYIENDSTMFQMQKKEAVKKLRRVEYDTSWIEKDRLMVEYRGGMKDADLTLRIRYIGRGNRWYSLLAMYPPVGQTAKVDSFFASFSELDYPVHAWQKAFPADSAFATWAPRSFSMKQNDSSDTYTYTSYDSTRATSYDIVAYKLGPYYWRNSDSAFWADRVGAHLLHYRDSLIEKKPVRNGGAEGWEWTKRERTSHLFYRERLILHGDRLYALVVNSAKDQIHTPDNDRFFEEFRFREPVSGNPYLHSKAELLLSDLFATDSATAEKAYSALQQATFDKRDLPLLLNDLLKVSPLDRKANSYKKVNHSLMLAIRSLKDTAASRFALQHYPSVPDSLAFIRNDLLALMAIPDSAHFAALTGLLRKEPPAEPISYYVIARLADTPALTAQFFPGMLPLLRDSLQRKEMLQLTAQQLDSNYLDIGRLAPYREGLQVYGERRAAKVISSADNYLYSDKHLIRILRHFNDVPANALLKRFLLSKEESLRLAAIVALLKNQQPVSNSVVLSLAANNSYRLELFQRLTEAGRMDLFPAAWRTQKAMGEAEVYLLASDYDEEEEEGDKPVITFFKETLVSLGGTRHRYLFYKVRRKDEVRLACAGPYSSDPEKLSTNDINAHICDELFSEAESAAQMNSLLKLFPDPKP